MNLLPGVYTAKKKNGDIYFRSNITYRMKHISLGSYATEEAAHKAYLTAHRILEDPTVSPEELLNTPERFSDLLFEKQICLVNFRDHNLYIANPIYLRRHFFEYYLTEDICLKFDIDDLFYYSSHKILMRNRHLCVADYGSQISLITRYGLKPYAVPGRDYLHLNQDPYDYRRINLEIINRYNGVHRIPYRNSYQYKAVIHIHGNYQIGIYDTEDEAAIAYNKAIDILRKKGVKKNFTPNFLDGLSPAVYASIYSAIRISDKIIHFSPKGSLP
ncbi:MAG: hypothetical protein ACI4F8_00640 [Lachnospiraceae bacterium]